jgi:hypothetical protein
MIETLAWVIIQVFLFSMSAWFVIFGIRVFNARKGLAVILFLFGFAGLVQVYQALVKQL